ncbi:MAG: exo-alpha-sialidase [Bacteroidales bacterium]|nr:exo-alpha-sialidase [Bacteroidales bacterium]
MNRLSSLFYFCVLLLAIACTRGPDGDKNKEEARSFISESIFPLQLQHCHGSTIVELPGGDLLAAWFQGSGERTADDVAIMGSRFNRSTGNWCKPFVMADTPDFPDINPVLFIDSRSKLWLVWYTVLAYQWESSVLKYRICVDYTKKNTAPDWEWQDMIHVKAGGSVPEGINRNDEFVKTLERKLGEYRQSLIADGYIREDGSGTISEGMWEAATGQMLHRARGLDLVSNGSDFDDKGNKVRARVGYPLMRRIGWQTRNKPLITGDRIILPLYSDGFDFSLMAITDNFGRTWHFSEPVVGGGNVQPALARAKDNTIVAWMRDNGPPPQRLMLSVSTDEGVTWSTVNDVEEGRHRLSVWLSEDEGKTWPFRKTVVDGKPGSETRGHYPAIIQGHDGRIHLTYTNQVAGPEGQTPVKNIVHASFAEKWLKE